MDQVSHKLKNRTLWFDGDSSFDGSDILSVVQHYPNVQFVNELTPLIEQYNNTVPSSERLSVKTNCRELSFQWNIPKKYLDVNVEKYIIKALDHELEHFKSDKDQFARLSRVAQEIKLYRKMGLIPVLRTIIYVINTLAANNIVWGVGRGSSVSSYVLYLIGAHDVDSVKYNLDIHDFLHN